MAKKSTKNTKKSTLAKQETKAVSKTEEKSQKKFFHDVEFNLHVIVYLFGVNIILICVVLFYVTQLQVLTQVEADTKGEFKFDDFTYYKYSLKEFSNFAKTPITNAVEMERYALDNGFDIIMRDKGYFHGEKEGSCFNDLTREEKRCRKAIIEYDEAEPNKVEIFAVREYQFDLNE